MRTPAELRGECRATIRAAKREPDPHLKRLMARHALALAQLAEKIERDQAASGRSPPRNAPSRRMLRVRLAVARELSIRARGVVAALAAIAGGDRADD
jgi:hypothetical protein